MSPGHGQAHPHAEAALGERVECEMARREGRPGVTPSAELGRLRLDRRARFLKHRRAGMMAPMSEEEEFHPQDETAAEPPAVPPPRENPLLLGHEPAEAALLQAYGAG